MLSNAVPEGVWKDTIRVNTDELRSAVVVAAFVLETKKQATLTRQTLANRNPATAGWLQVMALAASLAMPGSLAMLGGCAGSTSATTNVISDGGGTGGAGGAGNHADGGDAASVPLGCDNAMLVLDNNCTTTCHSMSSAPYFGGLDLMTANVAQRLVGKPAATMTSTNQAMCSGKGNLLNRGKLPATGIFIDKIKADPAMPGSVCGSPMPLGGSMLAQEDLDCLQAWANGLVNSVGP
jgi:hypothetical protein